MLSRACQDLQPEEADEMFRPEVFKQPYVAIRHIPYLCRDASGQESLGEV